MRQQLKKYLLIACLLAFPVVIVIMGPSFVKGLGVAVTATVTGLPPEETDTIVSFSGQAYPSTEVTVRRDGESFLTTPATSAGAFDASQVTDPGQYTFSISGRDADSREGPVFNVTVELDEGTTTTVSGIFLGPTIAIDRQEIAPGETLVIQGTTVPQSTVSIYIVSSSEQVFVVTAGSDGRWSKSVTAGSDSWSAGSYTGRARSAAPGGETSEYSATVSFVITEGTTPPTPTPTPTSTATPTPTATITTSVTPRVTPVVTATATPPTPGPSCALSLSGDIDCSGATDLSDLSILLYYWNSTGVTNRRADINGDGVVNMVDFSILLYYWTD